jgi:hypothetical protein
MIKDSIQCLISRQIKVIILIENDRLNGFWDDVMEPISQMLSSFDNNFLEFIEEDIGDSPKNRINESVIEEK